MTVAIRTGTREGVALRDVRSGSKADICSAPGHVCFTLESRHLHRTRSCLLWANSGL